MVAFGSSHGKYTSRSSFRLTCSFLLFFRICASWSRVIRGGLGIPWTTWALPGTHEAEMSKSAPRHRVGLMILSSLVQTKTVRRNGAEERQAHPLQVAGGIGRVTHALQGQPRSPVHDPALLDLDSDVERDTTRRFDGEC